MTEIETLKNQIAEYKKKLDEANENSKFIKEIYAAGKLAGRNELTTIATEISNKISYVEQLKSENKQLRDELAVTKSELANSLCCVIYSLKCLIINRIYIGSSKNFESRKYAHLNDLKNEVHCNDGLQNAFREHGEDQFVFEILEVCSLKRQLEREQFWIEKFNALNPEFGFNIKPATVNDKGDHSEESIKMSVASIRERLGARRNG